MAVPAKYKARLARARERVRETRSDVMIGGLIGAAAYGAVKDRLPDDLGPLPTRAVLGGAAIWWGMSQNKPYSIGAGIAVLAPYLESLAQGALDNE